MCRFTRSVISNFDEIVEQNNFDEDIVDLLTNIEEPVSSRKFRSSLVDLGMQFGFPTITNWEINRKCSLSCCHCYISAKELRSAKPDLVEQLPEYEIKSIIQTLVSIGVFMLVVTGGEPLLNKNLPVILNGASQYSMVVELFTNLQVLPKWFLDSIRRHGNIARIQTSVYSIDPEVHDKITNKKGSLAETLKNIAILRSLDCYVEIALPLMKINFSTRNETEAYFRDKGIPLSFSWPILNEYYDAHKTKAGLNVDLFEFKRFCNERPDFLSMNTKLAWVLAHLSSIEDV